MNQFQAWYRMQPAALRALLTVNVAIYVLWLLVFSRISATAALFLNHLALQADPATVLWQPWQFITYNFLHLSGGFGGLIHIGFNMLWMYWIGKEFEELHGSHKMFSLYIIAGIGGGLLSVIVYGLVGGLAGDAAQVIVYGASASVLGIMTAVAVLYPQKRIGLLFIGVIPLRWIVIGFLVLDFLFISGSSTAVWAHVGGALFGFLFARAEQSGIDLSGWAKMFFPVRGGYAASGGGGESILQRLENWLASRKQPQQKPPTKRRSSPLRKVETDVEVAEEPSLQTEVDRILDKISEEGYEALTPEEKRILYDASNQ